MNAIAASLATGNRFRDALVLADSSAFDALLAPEVLLWSPIRFAPYRGRGAARRLLSAMDRALVDVTFETPLAGPSRVAVSFEAQAADRRLQGVHLLDLNAEYRVVTLSLFLRPASGLEAARRAMMEILGAPPVQ